MNYEELLQYIQEVSGNDFADVFKDAHVILHKASGDAYISNLNIVIGDNQDTTDALVVDALFHEMKDIFTRILLEQGIRVKDDVTQKQLTQMLSAVDMLIEYEHKEDIIQELESSIVDTEKFSRVLNIVTGIPSDSFSEMLLFLNPSLINRIREMMKYQIKIESNSERIAPYATTYGKFLKIHSEPCLSNQFAYDIDSIGLPYVTYTRILFGRYDQVYKDDMNSFAYALVGCALLAIDGYKDPMTIIAKTLEDNHMEVDVINKVTLIIRSILNEMQK